MVSHVFTLASISIPPLHQRINECSQLFPARMHMAYNSQAHHGSANIVRARDRLDSSKHKLGISRRQNPLNVAQPPARIGFPRLSPASFHLQAHHHGFKLRRPAFFEFFNALALDSIVCKAGTEARSGTDTMPSDIATLCAPTST